MAHGLTSDDDINISKRLAAPMPPDSGKEAGITIAPYVEGWIRDYYNFLGWDRKMGRPWVSTLKKLGLEEFQNLVWKA
jgi:aldehyde:ferredoxin oxidoreductase